MNYQETLDYLYALLPVFQRVGKAAYKATLDNTRKLDEYFHSPHKKFPSVHVAGTNGKGSVSHMLASVYQQAGYKTGLYTSPHYIDFRERIKINGQCIEQKAVIDFVETHKGFIEDLKPSFFELTVALAFYYFAENKVDIAIIEVGMGGRLDSTNIITPLVSVITNIGYDHQQFLGSTLPEIAREKAGIIKPGVAVVVNEYQSEVYSVFEQVSSENHVPIQYADARFTIPWQTITLDNKQRFSVYAGDEASYPNLELDLAGHYQLKNVKGVLYVIEQLQSLFPIDRRAIYEGLSQVQKNTGMIGRFMYLGYNPRIICDAGHNKEGIALAMQQVQNIPYKKLHLILGFVSDKNLDGVLDQFPAEAYYWFTQADIPRALPASELQKNARETGREGKVYARVAEAVKASERQAGEHDLIFIGGSTFVVSEAIIYKKMAKSICL